MKISNIFDKNEVSTEDTFEKAKSLLENKETFIHRFFCTPFFNDEPKYFQYITIVKKSSDYPSFYGVGCSPNEKIAQMKSLTEIMERYCLYVKDKRKFIKSSFEKLNNALDPTSVISFSKSQLRKRMFKKFRVTRNSLLKWTHGISLIREKPILIPVQLLSLSHVFEDEPIIKIPISNGASTGTSMAGATTRAIWECIERDAFIITYLNKLPRSRVITDDQDIGDILALFHRYRLEVYSFDITTDIKVPTIFSIVIDRTGKGPAISVGMKCDLNAKNALIGSILEATSLRLNVRKIFMTEYVKQPKKINIKNHRDRGLYWSSLSMIRHLNFLLDSKNVKNLERIKSYKGDSLSNLKKTISILKKKNIETIVADITKPVIRRFGFRVVYAIMPELQPFYLLERYPYLGGTRLYTVPKTLGYTDKETTETQLNKIPHPF